MYCFLPLHELILLKTSTTVNGIFYIIKTLLWFSLYPFVFVLEVWIISRSLSNSQFWSKSKAWLSFWLWLASRAMSMEILTKVRNSIFKYCAHNKMVFIFIHHQKHHWLTCALGCSEMHTHWARFLGSQYVLCIYINMKITTKNRPQNSKIWLGHMILFYKGILPKIQRILYGQLVSGITFDRLLEYF